MKIRINYVLLFAAIISAIAIPAIVFSSGGGTFNGNNSNLPSPLTKNETQNAPTTSQPATTVNVCESSPIAKSTEFIQEYEIPLACTQPVAIAVDDHDKVWVAATWTGHLLVFDPEAKKFTETIKIPEWKIGKVYGSLVWGMKFDKKGDLWFSDQLNNAIWRYFVHEKRFEMHRVPTPNGYPAEIDFDSKGKVWLTEIFGKKLGLIDPVKTEKNSTKGITEYDVKGAAQFETMGPVTVINNKYGKENDAVWFTAVTFPEGGQIVRFEPVTENFTFYDLPKGAGVPVGLVEDKDGRLWINDHASNRFFMFNPATKDFLQYSTSLPTSRNSTTTLPYWNMIRDNRIWFNEHEGNAIAYFDIENSTLVEYQIPTRPQLWGNTSNPLKFDIDSKGSVWFTEWTENKIGVLESEKLNKLPIWLSVSKDKLQLNSQDLQGSGDELTILVHPNRTKLNEAVKMTVASSVSQSGRLYNLTASFSEPEFYFRNGSNEPHAVILKLKPTTNLLPGEYTVTIGARYGTVTYNKIVNLHVK